MDERPEDEPWFDETGTPVRKIPDACVAEIAVSGDNGPAVAKWTAKLEFGKGLDQDLARGHIMESGAYTLLEVVRKTDEEVVQWILWSMCWNIKDEEGEDSPLVGMFDSRRLSQFLKERVCRNWGYENGHDARTSVQFKDACRVHDALVERHPAKHRMSETDTIRGDHHRDCSCGFRFAWDTSD